MGCNYKYIYSSTEQIRNICILVIFFIFLFSLRYISKGNIVVFPSLHLFDSFGH